MFDWVDPKTLKPNHKNPNRHGQDQIDRLCELIKAYGWRHPIILDRKSNQIVVGHGRWQAAIQMGLTSVPIHVQDFKDEDEVYGFMVADNSSAAWSELDLSMINLEIPNLSPEFKIDWLGIKDFTIDRFEKPSKEPFKCPECGYVKSKENK